MKQLIVFLLGILIFSSEIYAHNLADAIEQALPSITYVEVDNYVTKRIVNSTTKTITELREKTSPSSGTGFVIENNKIVTNYHVISSAVLSDADIWIIFDKNNGIRYKATILGFDEIADVALLQIKGNHPSLTIADNVTNMRMGDNIFTISNYYGIRHSASVGIISSINRRDNRYPYIRLFQLQILEGSGSSGGPVLNVDGEVVALNHRILSMMPDSILKTSRPWLMSMTAFTIRGDQLKRSIKRIKEEGIVIHMDLGLYLENYGATSENFLYDPIPNSNGISGVLVLDALENAQFNRNDIIVSLDGNEFTDASELLLWLDRNKQEGDTVNIQVYRDGMLLNITTEVKIARNFL